MVRIASASLASPSATIFAGVSTSANNGPVALFTPLSVACADNTTATSKVYGLTCSSSPFGSGLAACNRAKKSWISDLLKQVVIVCPRKIRGFAPGPRREVAIYHHAA